MVEEEEENDVGNSQTDNISSKIESIPRENDVSIEGNNSSPSESEPSIAIEQPYVRKIKLEEELLNVIEEMK